MKSLMNHSPFKTLGDPSRVAELLAIVTGSRFRAVGGAATYWTGQAATAERPLRMERTPSPIRALREEGIIGTVSGRFTRRDQES